AGASATHRGREPPVTEPDLVLLAGLAAEAERDRRPVDPGVAIVERGQAERPIEPCVLIVADTDQGQLQQPDDGGPQLLPGEARPREVAVDLFPDRRQSAGEGDEPLELGGVAPRAVAGVVAVLLAAARVTAGRLEVAVGPRADPDVGPGGRDDDLPNPLQDFLVADQPAIGGEIAEAPTGSASR